MDVDASGAVIIRSKVIGNRVDGRVMYVLFVGVSYSALDKYRVIVGVRVVRWCVE